jgi:hypothetical protein
MRLHSIGWEIDQVPGHDSIRFGLNGSGQDMPVVFIGERQAFDVLLVIPDQTITRMQVHELPCSLKLRSREVRSLTQHGGHPFLVNLLRPLRLNQFMHRQPHQQVTQRRWIEDTGIEQDNGRARDQ